MSSAGMLCSEAELGVGADASGILILPNDAAIGERVAVVLGLEDTVLEIGITPNRGDCLSILGIAREIAALTGTARAAPAAGACASRRMRRRDLIAIRIADPDLCGRYVGRVLGERQDRAVAAVAAAAACAPSACGRSTTSSTSPTT